MAYSTPSSTIWLKQPRRLQNQWCVEWRGCSLEFYVNVSRILCSSSGGVARFHPQALKPNFTLSFVQEFTPQPSNNLARRDVGGHLGEVNSSALVQLSWLATTQRLVLVYMRQATPSTSWFKEVVSSYNLNNSCFQPEVIRSYHTSLSFEVLVNGTSILLSRILYYIIHVWAARGSCEQAVDAWVCMCV